MVSDRFVARLVRVKEPQYALATAAGISPSRLSRIVHGKASELGGSLTTNDRRALELIAARLGLSSAETFVE